MPDYYTFESEFETGDFTEWSAGKTDTDSKLTADHYVKLVTNLGMFPDPVPWRGAYCAHIDLSLGTNDAYVQDTSWASALNTTIWASFYVQVTNNLVQAALDRPCLFAMQSTGATDQATVTLYASTATRPQLVLAQTRVTAIGANTRATDLGLNQWHLVEVGVSVGSGGADGSIQMWVDGFQVGTTISSLTMAALTQLRLGALSIPVGTTAGHILYDQVIQTGARLGGWWNRHPQVLPLTKSGFIFLGPGKIEEFALVPGGLVDNQMGLFDADIQSMVTNISNTIGPTLANSAPFEPKVYAFSRKAGYFTRGCYARLTGSAPRATVTFGGSQSSVGLIKQYALRRR